MVSWAQRIQQMLQDKMADFLNIIFSMADFLKILGRRGTATLKVVYDDVICPLGLFEIG